MIQLYLIMDVEKWSYADSLCLLPDISYAGDDRTPALKRRRNVWQDRYQRAHAYFVTLNIANQRWSSIWRLASRRPAPSRTQRITRLHRRAEHCTCFNEIGAKKRGSRKHLPKAACRAMLEGWPSKRRKRPGQGSKLIHLSKRIITGFRYLCGKKNI